MDDKGVLLIEIISTLFVAKLVEEQMLNRTQRLKIHLKS